MKYTIERYSNHIRFNEQYETIYRFLLHSADTGYNEHFHWGRFEWMMRHTMLDMEALTKIAVFKDTQDVIVGLVTYDCEPEDGIYLIHSIEDVALLESMVEYVEDTFGIEKAPSIHANSNDVTLLGVLKRKGYERIRKTDSVLSIGLEDHMEFSLPEGIKISPLDFAFDPWKYQNVIHKGFGNIGEPEPWDPEVFEPTPNVNNALKVFAINDQEYCAHCGVWFSQGKTAYIEPVVTIPAYRKKGLAKACVYEAIQRARYLGAQRAVVLSGQQFYYKIGFKQSSEVHCWERTATL